MGSNVEPQPQSLADSINGATRKAHATLNKLIVARLPEALPPHAADPAPYVTGLLHIAPVYIQFEGLWQSILNTAPSLAPTGSIPDACDPTFPILDSGSILTPLSDDIKVHRPLTCDRLQSLLEHLQLPGLMRSGQLRADLRSLTRWPSSDIEVELRKVGEAGALGDFLDHMRRSVSDKPHVLVAYTYIFYMALFAGGRFIRASLEHAGPDFWSRQPSPIKPTMRACGPAPLSDDEQPAPGGESDTASDFVGGHTSHNGYRFPLRFLHFSTPSDGEDLKKEFKERLAHTETILTSRERMDIVQEAIAIFDHMTLIVGQLHVLCAGPAEVTTSTASSLFGLPKSLILARLRDSVAVAKDRRSARRLPDDGMSSSEGGYEYARGASKPHAKSSSEGNGQTFSRAPVPGQMAPKSVRFEGTLLQPDRKQSLGYDGSSDLLESVRHSPPRSFSSSIIRWALTVIVLLGLLAARAYWRRGLAGASEV